MSESKKVKVAPVHYAVDDEENNHADEDSAEHLGVPLHKSHTLPAVFATFSERVKFDPGLLPLTGLNEHRKGPVRAR